MVFYPARSPIARGQRNSRLMRATASRTVVKSVINEARQICLENPAMLPGLRGVETKRARKETRPRDSKRTASARSQGEGVNIKRIRRQTPRASVGRQESDVLFHFSLLRNWQRFSFPLGRVLLRRPTCSTFFLLKRVDDGQDRVYSVSCFSNK